MQRPSGILAAGADVNARGYVRSDCWYWALSPLQSYLGLLYTVFSSLVCSLAGPRSTARLTMATLVSWPCF